MLDLLNAILNMAVFGLVGLLALIGCLTGSRFLRLWLALVGFVSGYFMGLQWGPLMITDPVYQLVAAFLSGIVLGGFFCILPRAGALLAGAGVMLLLADEVLRIFPAIPDFVKIWFIILLMLAGAALGVLHIKAFLALTSAFAGGWLVSFCVGGIILDWPLEQTVVQYNTLGGPGLILILIGTGVLFILGTFSQFALLKRAAKKAIVPVTDTETADDVKPSDLVLPEAPADVSVESLETPEEAPEQPVSTQE